MQGNEVRQIQDWLNTRRETTFRWGTRMLRGGQRYYSPCVLDRTGWENYYLSLPYDYDVRNDKVFSAAFSTYKRLGDLGFPWPEPTTQEALRIGYCGPDKDAYSRPAFLRFRENDKRPEPAYRLHLADRTNLHYLNSDPLEGVTPYGRSGDMLKAKSVSHRDYKWRRRCCPRLPSKPTYEKEATRFCKTDLQLRASGLVDKVVKFDDDANYGELFDSGLMKLKKAYYWPINPITDEPLGGTLSYREDPGPECKQIQNRIWPRGNVPASEESEPIRIPRDRCQVLAIKPKEYKPELCPLDPTGNLTVYLKTRWPQPNWECWEEVPDSCKREIPSECCFYPTKTKGSNQSNKAVCPPRPPCPNLYAYK